jgi:hypothetical protein
MNELVPKLKIRTLVLGLLAVNKVKAFGLDLAVNEGANNTGAEGSELSTN